MEVTESWLGRGLLLCGIPVSKAVPLEKKRVKKKGGGGAGGKAQLPFPHVRYLSQSRGLAYYLPRTAVASELRLGSPFHADIEHVQL